MYAPLMDIIKAIGLPAAMKLVENFGGTRIYLPQPEKVDADNEIAKIIGVEAARALALEIARRRGMFKPEIKVTISVRPAADVASMSAAAFNEYTVVVRPQVFVDWTLLYDAARGSGNVVIPKEFAPPSN